MVGLSKVRGPHTYFILREVFQKDFQNVLIVFEIKLKNTFEKIYTCSITHKIQSSF